MSGENKDCASHLVTANELVAKDKRRLLIPPFIKRAIWSLLVNRAFGSIIGLIYRNRIPHRGSVLDTTSPRINAEEKALLFWNWYERSEIDQAEAFLLPGYDVVQLGASIGANTLQILKKISGDRVLIAVEADPELTEILQKNIRCNDLISGNCHVLNAAIMYEDADLVRVVQGSSSLSGRVESDDSPQPSAGTTVPTITLGQIITEFDIGDYCLVVDIEGSEVGMFFEDAKALSRCARLLIEVDGGTFKGRLYRIKDVVAQAERIGFRRLYCHANRMVFENKRFFQTGSVESPAAGRPNGDPRSTE